MAEFIIYKKYSPFYLTKTIVAYMAAFIVIAVLVFVTSFYKAVPAVLQYLLGCVGIVALLYGAFKRTASAGKHEELTGELTAKLVLEQEAVTVDAVIYNLNSIQKIELYAGDYYGREVYDYKKRQQLSNGFNNSVELFLYSGKQVKVNFQIMGDKRMMPHKELLVHYYNRGKLPEPFLISALGVTDKEEANKFKTIKYT